MRAEADTTSREHKRRRYDAAFKRELVERTLAPGASVARIAREHDINTNQLFNWRRQQLRAEQGRAAGHDSAKASASLIPVTMVGAEAVPIDACASMSAEGQIEIRLGAAQVCIRGAVDVATLQVVLSSLRK